MQVIRICTRQGRVLARQDKSEQHGARCRMNMQCKLERTVHLHLILHGKLKDANEDVLHITCWQRKEQTTYDGTHSAPNDVTTHYDPTKHQHLHLILYFKLINKIFFFFTQLYI